MEHVKAFLLGGMSLPLKVALCGEETFIQRQVILQAKAMVGFDDYISTTSEDFLHALQDTHKLILFATDTLPCSEDDVLAYDGSVILTVPYKLAYRLRKIRTIKCPYLYDKDTNLYMKDFLKETQLQDLPPDSIKLLKHKLGNSLVDIKNTLHLMQIYGTESITDSWLHNFLDTVNVDSLNLIWNNFVKGYTRLLMGVLREENIKSILKVMFNKVVFMLRVAFYMDSNVPLADCELYLDKHQFVIQKCYEEYAQLGGGAKVNGLLSLLTKWMCALESKDKTGHQVITELVLFRENLK